MDSLPVSGHDTIDLSDKDFFFSHRIVTQTFNMYKTHAHDNYELYYLESGRRDYFIGNRIVHIKAGDFVFVPSHTIHKTTSVSPEGHERFLINFTEDFFEYPLKKDVLNVFKDYCLSIPEENKDMILEIFKKISDEYENQDTHSPILLKAYLSELFIILLRIGSPIHSLNRIENKTEIHIKKVLDLLDNNISSEITVDYAAKIAHLSKSHFEKNFRLLTGFTFVDYLNTMRIKRAQKLLSKTSKSITDIAFECGFNSSNYFITVFKSYNGITPFQFRKKENGN